MAKFIIIIIEFYQKTISPDHGVFRSRYPHGFCKYYPSCSEYAKQSFQKYGLFKGFFKTILRISRCNPFTKNRLDPA